VDLPRRARILAEMSPIADLLRDGIYELRVRAGRVNYRILYFFHGRNIAVVSHGITKEDRVPAKEIDLAIRRRALIQANSHVHVAEW
jgi:phage-related protein